MLVMMLEIASICFTILAGVFAAYFFLVIQSPKRFTYLQAVEDAIGRTIDANGLPKISIVVPAYDEEEVIGAKLRDLAAMQYPRDKLEVILIDDFSTDHTSVIAEQMFRELGLPGKIIKNTEKIGVNGSYNIGVRESAGELVATTDADVMVDHQALISGVKVLYGLRDVGGVTGKMVPVHSGWSTTVRTERSYRDFYNAMLVAESALYSTFPGYGEFTLLRKSAFVPMPVGYGSSDSNISLAIIRKGLRFLCVPSIAFYEPIATTFGEQLRQKTRRAARMIQGGWANRDMLLRERYGDFGRRIFPLRFLMMTVCPLLFLVGSIAVVVADGFMGLPFIVLLVTLLLSYIGGKIRPGNIGLLYSLVVHQCYLLVGLLLSGRRGSVWRPIQRVSVIRRS